MFLDNDKIRAQFPILKCAIHDKPLAYLDSAGSSQKPTAVLDALQNFYTTQNANINRGAYTLSERATYAYELAREKARQFINAKSAEEIIFTSGTTHAINLAAQSFGKLAIAAGDEIVLSVMEHHSNIVPWQMLCEQIGAKIKVLPINSHGKISLKEFEALLSARTKIVAIAHISNVLGTINPIKEIIQIAHTKNIPVLVDGAQAVAHVPVDVSDLDCDFYAFSGHKMCGPTGIGVLYGKKKWLAEMPPYQGGGGMIQAVELPIAPLDSRNESGDHQTSPYGKTTYAELPSKFEAGTPNIAGAVGLGAAIDYLTEIGLANIAEYEHDLLAYATAQLQAIAGLRIIGEAPDKAAVISFVIDGIHPHDLSTILDTEGVAVRAGHHCAMPLMEYYGLTATTRASLCVYNNRADVNALVGAIKKAREILG